MDPDCDVNIVFTEWASDVRLQPRVDAPLVYNVLARELAYLFTGLKVVEACMTSS